MASSSSTSKRWIVAVYAASSYVPHEASKAEKDRLCKSIVMTMTNEQRKTRRKKRKLASSRRRRQDSKIQKDSSPSSTFSGRSTTHLRTGRGDTEALRPPDSSFIPYVIDVPHGAKHRELELGQRSLEGGTRSAGDHHWQWRLGRRMQSGHNACFRFCTEALVLVPTHPFPITFLSPETLCISLTSFLVFCSLGLGNCFGFGRRGRVGVRIMRGVVE
jgi:hypothetical protein